MGGFTTVLGIISNIFPGGSTEGGKQQRGKAGKKNEGGGVVL